jgi:hypothetical protein
VVVAVTITVVQATAFTVPTVGAMLTVVALVTFQHSDTWPPPVGTTDGEAVKLSTLGTPAPATVTVTAALTEVTPSAPVAVRVYVVVAVGETLWLPFTGTVPTPLLIVTEEAPVVVQDSSEDPPLLMLVGEAANRMMAGLDAPTVTVTLAVIDWPPDPVAVKL